MCSDRAPRVRKPPIVGVGAGCHGFKTSDSGVKPGDIVIWFVFDKTRLGYEAI